MKKKILLVLLILVVMFLSYKIYIKISFNNLVNNTINYNDKINYSTDITTSIKGKDYLKINYQIIKTSNKKKIILSNYINDNLENQIEKYIINDKAYIYNNDKFEEIKNNEEKINVNYKKLKQSKVKLLTNNSYMIKMKASDAYNMVDIKDVMKEKDLNKNIIVTVKKDENNNFIKEISYTIDNLNNNKDNPLKYKVEIINTDINNSNNIKLPF